MHGSAAEAEISGKRKGRFKAAFSSAEDLMRHRKCLRPGAS